MDQADSRHSACGPAEWRKPVAVGLQQSIWTECPVEEAALMQEHRIDHHDVVLDITVIIISTAGVAQQLPLAGLHPLDRRLGQLFLVDAEQGAGSTHLRGGDKAGFLKSISRCVL